MKYALSLILLASSLAIADPKEKTAYYTTVYSGAQQIGAFVSTKKPTYANGVCTFNSPAGQEVVVSGTYLVMEMSVSDIPALPAKQNSR